MECGIYKIVNTRNGKCYYGSSKEVEKRWKRHLNDLKNNRHNNVYLQRVWNKYGNVFEFEMVEECGGSLLLEIEQRYLDENIDGYNIGRTACGGDNISNNPNRDRIIQNITDGINKRYSELSDEEKKEIYGRDGKLNHNWRGGTTFCNCGTRISSNTKKCIKCYDKSGDKNPFYGKTHTNETKMKLSEISTKRGYVGNQNIEFEIDCVRYKSLGEASKELDIPTTTIRWRIKSENKKYENYKYIK